LAAYVREGIEEIGLFESRRGTCSFQASPHTAPGSGAPPGPPWWRPGIGGRLDLDLAAVVVAEPHDRPTGRPQVRQPGSDGSLETTIVGPQADVAAESPAVVGPGRIEQLPNRHADVTARPNSSSTVTLRPSLDGD